MSSSPSGNDPHTSFPGNEEPASPPGLSETLRQNSEEIPDTSTPEAPVETPGTTTSPAAVLSSPATVSGNEPVLSARVQVVGSKDLHESLTFARSAQKEWAATPISARIRAFRQIKKRFLERAEAIARCVSKECGKPIQEALLADVLTVADVFDYWINHIEDLLEPDELSLDPLSYPSKQGVVTREARGVIALITPWNYPIAIPLRTMVPALLSGNAIMFKPSEITPESGEQLDMLFAGLIPGGLLTLCKGGPEVGQALMATDIDLVVFTGSVRTGKLVAKQCAEKLIPCSLELGGKDAAIVMSDANLDRTVHGIAWGALTNAGQNCASIERIYVEQPIAEAFLAKLTAYVKTLRPGIDVGALTTPGQLAIVRSQVEQAIQDGGQLLVGELPSDPQEQLVPPLVILITNEDTPLMMEETFGPVLPIVVVPSVEDAIWKANQSKFGLTASIWSKNIGKAQFLAQQLRAGVITINNHGFTGAIPSAPWSGVGESGYGITNSPHALAELTRPRLLLSDRNRAKKELHWHPYDERLETIAEAMCALKGGAGIFQRIGALFRLIPAFLGRMFAS
jgi:acyl-CoA reductase-like NAD-dependent aldehyde dehydrogenase